MRLEDVVWFCQLMRQYRLRIWIDGGWGVDALLKRQTRNHDDLDIVVEAQDLPQLVDLLSSQGFVSSDSEDHRDWNFVLSDGCGREIDIHVINIDSLGNGIYGPKAAGEAYPAASLGGQGQIGTLAVSCISEDYQLASHNAGYPLRTRDIDDMKALCEVYGLELPDRFKEGVPD